MRSHAITPFERQIIKAMRDQLDEHQISVTKLADEAKLPRPMVSRILSGKQRASFEMWDRLRAIAFRMGTEKKGT